MVRRAWRIIPVAIILWLSAARQVSARPAHKRALADYFGPMLPKKLNDCRTCHLPDPPGTTADQLASEKPHNPFGARLKAIKSEMRKAGKTIDIPTLLITGDEDLTTGVNEAEFMRGHIPGSRMSVIGKGGHYSVWERPEESARVLRHFLDATVGLRT